MTQDHKDQHGGRMDTAMHAEEAMPMRRGFVPHPRPQAAEFEWSDGAASIRYLAEAAHLDVREDDGEPIASMFALTYTALETSGEDIAQTGAERPVTFLFNGGPGSSSVWLNTGGFGPRKSPSRAPESAGLPPYAIEDNPHTLLRQSDLVFLDAPGTGWSTLAEGVPSSRVWGVDGDADVFCRAMLAWLAEHRRWNAPKYVFGESYGTTRAAVMANLIQNRCMDLSGVVMLSTLLDWASTLSGADAGYVQLIPSFAAAARYHGTLVPELAAMLEDASDEKVERFALGEYATALLQADTLPHDRLDHVAGRLSAFIGIPRQELIDRHLRVGMEEFRSLLLREHGVVIGRFDSRFASHGGAIPGLAGGVDPATNDAATAGVNSAETSAFRMILDEIGYTWDRPYLVLNNMAVEPNWVWAHRAPGTDASSPIPNAAYDLASALRRNPDLKVAIMSGRYDLACPYAGCRQDIAHLYLAPQLRENVSFGLYETGHMAYADASALKTMSKDLDRFYASGHFRI